MYCAILNILLAVLSSILPYPPLGCLHLVYFPSQLSVIYSVSLRYKEESRNSQPCVPFRVLSFCCLKLVFPSTWPHRTRELRMKISKCVLIYSSLTSVLDFSIPNSLFFFDKLFLFSFTTRHCPYDGPNTQAFATLLLIIILGEPF